MQSFRNCLKYVRSDSVPSRPLPNSCLLNPGRGPKSNRISRLFPGSLHRAPLKIRTNPGVSKLTRFKNTENLVNPLFLDMDVVKTLSIIWWGNQKKCWKHSNKDNTCGFADFKRREGEIQVLAFPVGKRNRTRSNSAAVCNCCCCCLAIEQMILSSPKWKCSAGVTQMNAIFWLKASHS